MSRTSRMILLLGTGFLAGGIVGAYAMTVVYGEGQERVSPVSRDAGACPACPICPPPPTCEKVVEAPVPDDEPPPPPPEAPTGPTGAPPPELPLEPPKPGLPASAITMVTQALSREAGPCVAEARAAGVHGMVLLDLTITATSGIGRIHNVEVAKREGSVETAEGCLVTAARKVQFEWTGSDGEARLKYPVQIAE